MKLYLYMMLFCNTLNSTQPDTTMDYTTLPVMKACCKSCPFKTDDTGKWQNIELASEVVNRTLFKGHQICHSTEGKNRDPHNRCKGLFDHNSEIYTRMGFGEFIK